MLEPPDTQPDLRAGEVDARGVTYFASLTSLTFQYNVYILNDSTVCV